MALAFFIFPLTFAMQVWTQNVQFALIPYGLFILSMVGVVTKAAPTGQVTSAIRGTNYLDVMIATLLVLNTLHIGVGVLAEGYSLAEALRLFLIYVVSGWAYFFASRFCGEAQLRSILILMGVAGAIVGLEWMHETYSKNVLGIIPEFQVDAHHYRVTRGATEGLDEVPISLRSEYVAFGLVETHTTTGATIALAAFGIAMLFPADRRRPRMFVLAAGLFVLFFGGAKLALISYLFTSCLLLIFGNLDNARRGGLFAIGTFLAIVLLLAPLVTQYSSWGMELFALKRETYGLTIEGLLRLTYWRELFSDAVTNYFEFLQGRPLALALGQGPQPYGEVVYRQGGDFAFLEVLAKYGVVFTVGFLYAAGRALRQVKLALQSGRYRGTDTQHLLAFSFAVTLFLLLSLAHYDTILRKSIIVCFFLALGIIRRYAWQEGVKRGKFHVA